MGETPHDLFYQPILIGLYGKSSFLIKNKGLCDQFFMTSEYEKNDKILWVIVDNLFEHMMKSRILPINLCTDFPPCHTIDVCICLRLERNRRMKMVEMRIFVVCKSIFELCEYIIRRNDRMHK